MAARVFVVASRDSNKPRGDEAGWTCVSRVGWRKVGAVGGPSYLCGLPRP